MKKIICLCPTHGRPYMVEEAIGSFVRQCPTEYEHEMLIVNDCPEQHLSCNVPGVRVVNLPTMYADVSEKFNAAVDLADCDYVAWWEDDDISLPFRLGCSIPTGENEVYKQSRAWFWNHGHITARPVNLFFGSAIFWRSAWRGATPGQPGDKSAWENMTNHAECGWEHYPPAHSTYFVYRWAGTGHHDSEVRGTNADRFKAFRRAILNDPRFVAGHIELRARWDADYAAQVEQAIRDGKGGIL